MTPWQRALLLGSSVLTGGTGLVYWWMDSFMEPTDEWSMINHPLQPWVLKAHILGSPVMVFALGLIVADHVSRHLRDAGPLGRRTGLTMLWIAAPMILTGYLIQVVTVETLLGVVSWAHIVTSALFLAGLGSHVFLLRRIRRSDSPYSHPPS